VEIARNAEKGLRAGMGQLTTLSVRGLVGNPLEYRIGIGRATCRQ
jgi:hypothetical protein